MRSAHNGGMHPQGETLTSLHPRCAKRLTIALLAMHAALLVWSAWIHSPTGDEVAYLPAGLSHWEFGRFELYCANPPLVRLLAAIPVLAVPHRTDWSRFSDRVGARAEFPVGCDFVAVNGENVFWLFAIARWACIPLSLLGGYICQRWARELFSDWKAGLVALSLWCCDPNLLASGFLITPDMGATSLGLAAAYNFWRWIRAPTFSSSLLVGFSLGLAELAKSNWIVLFLLWPVLWLAVRAPWSPMCGREMAKQAFQLATAFALCLVMMNGCYGWEGSFQRLGDYEFVSETFGSRNGLGDGNTGDIGNRFRGTFLGDLPVPLPQQYVQGIDIQRRAVERESGSYLRGVWRGEGWWYYYLYAALVKTPVGTWLLVTLTACVTFSDVRFRCAWRDELLWFAPLVTMLVFVSSQSGINRHFRYALPIFPLVFVGVARIAWAFPLQRTAVAIAAATALLVTTVESLFVYPHSMSFFNLAAGGPTHGPRHLLGTNIDWGQDLFLIKEWIDRHSTASPVHLSYSLGHMTDPQLAGIRYKPISQEPSPGWFLLSVNVLFSESGNDRYFLNWQPVDRIGYTTYVYHVTPEQAEKARAALRRGSVP